MTDAMNAKPRAHTRRQRRTRGVQPESDERRDKRQEFLTRREFLDELQASLTPERFGTYLNAAGGDRKEASRLYVWNTEVSAAFYGPLQGLEVTLRNAAHQRLAECYGLAWYDNPDTGLDGGAIERIAAAKSEPMRHDSPGDASRVVAALSFGFWVSLFGRGGRLESGGKANYEMVLWRPALRSAFPHCATLNRKRVHGMLNGLRILRNRIAHHEPVFARNLAEDHQRILEVTGWMSPVMRTLTERHSRVPALLRCPEDVERTRLR